MKARILKFLSLAFALLLLLSCAVGCKRGGEESGDTVNTVSTGGAEDDGYVKDDLPDDLDFGGKAVKILTWEETRADDWADNLNGETINDATYKSRQEVAARLNVTFDVSAQQGSWDFRNQFSTNLEAYIQSGLAFDIVGQYTPTAALTATRGLAINMADLKYLNFEKPWWPGDLMESCRIGDNLYFCSGDITPTCINAIGTVFVNLDLMEQYKIEEDIYEVVESGEWTLEKCKTMFTGKVGTGEGADLETYGVIIANRGIYDNFFYGGGLTYVTHDDKNQLVLNEDVVGEKMDNWYKACQSFLIDNPDVTYLMEYDEEQTIENTFMNGKSIVYMSQVLTDAKQYLRAAEFNFAVVPYPKYDTDQTQYHSITGYWVTMFSIPPTVEDADMAAAVLEALGSSGYRSMTPKIYEESFQYRFLQNEKNAKMLDLIHDTMTYDTGRIFSDDIAMFNLFRAAYDKDTSWTTTLAKKLDIWQANIEKVNSILG